MTSRGSKYCDIFSSVQSPQFYNSAYLQQNLIKTSNMQQYAVVDKKDHQEEDDWTQEEKDKFKQIIKMMKRMKDQRRAHDLVMNLPTRMLKSFDQNKFSLLNDKSFHYDESSYLDLINQYIMDNTKRVEPLKPPDNKTFNELNSMSYNGQIDKFKTFKDSIVGKFQQLRPSGSTSKNKSKIDMKLIGSNLNIMKNILIRILDQIPIIQPSSTFKLGWDLIFMFVVITCLFYLPVTIAFGFSFSQLLSIDLLVLIPTLLVFDIIIRINTGYFEKGQVTKSRYKIMEKYLKKNLIKDAVSVLPFILSLYYEAGQQLQENKDTKATYLWVSNTFTQFLLLPFFFKGISLGSTLKKIEERFNLPRILTNIIQLAKLLFTIILINHLFACLWVLAARLEYQSGQLKTWMHSEGLQKSSWVSQYLAAFYFTTVTMITVGYGDILPQNELEQVLCVITMMLACGVFGYSLNEVGSIFSNFFQVDNEIKKKLILIQRFMSKKNINSKLQYQIREYLEYYWREQAETDYEKEQDIIDQLSDSLKQKLLFEANKIVLKDNPIFKFNFSKIVNELTVPLIQEMKYSPESLICQEGQLDDSSIYFIENGSVDIVMNPKEKKLESLFKLSKGNFFGAHTFFTGLPRINNVRSNEFTTVLKIRRQDFIQLLQNFPEDYETFCAIRDSISYLSDYSRIGLKCIGCNSYHHLVNNCQYLHYVPKKARIIKIYNDFNNISHMQRTPYQRREPKHNESLFNFSEDETLYSEGFFNQDSLKIEIPPLSPTDQKHEQKRDIANMSIVSDNVIKESDNESSRSHIFHKKGTISRFGQDHNNLNKSFNSVDRHIEFGQSHSNLVYTDTTSQNIFDQVMHSMGHNTLGTPTLDHDLVSKRKPMTPSSRKNIDKQFSSVSRTRSNTEKSENIAENYQSFSQINAIQNNEIALKFPTQNRKRSITTQDEGKGREILEKFKKSRTTMQQQQQKNQKETTYNLIDDGEITPTQNGQKMLSKQFSNNEKIRQKIYSSLLNKQNSSSVNEPNILDQILNQLQTMMVQNQQSQFNAYKDGHSSNEFDQYDIFLYFDKMKQFVKYNPRYNFSSVISRYNQFYEQMKKQLRASKSNRHSRIRNTQFTKTQIRLLELSQSFADGRKITRLQTTQNQNTNNYYENTDSKKVNINTTGKKCDSDLDVIGGFKDLNQKLIFELSPFATEQNSFNKNESVNNNLGNLGYGLKQSIEFSKYSFFKDKSNIDQDLDKQSQEDQDDALTDEDYEKSKYNIPNSFNFVKSKIGERSFQEN